MVEMTLKNIFVVALAAMLITAPAPSSKVFKPLSPRRQAPPARRVPHHFRPKRSSHSSHRLRLYPDQLVAQILSGATFPNQIAIAGNWMEQHQGLKGKDLVKEVNKESWDSSVKALTAFPSVLRQHGEEPELDLVTG